MRGIADVRWSARLEVLSTNGSTLVVDGAHNPHSMGRLVEARSGELPVQSCYPDIRVAWADTARRAWWTPSRSYRRWS